MGLYYPASSIASVQLLPFNCKWFLGPGRVQRGEPGRKRMEEPLIQQDLSACYCSFWLTCLEALLFGLYFITTNRGVSSHCHYFRRRLVLFVVGNSVLV
jgi:hypothetical protein